MTTLWALIIGIDKYPIDPIEGAEADANAVEKYLLQERHVRRECVVVMRQQDARREAIIQTFISHLIENKKIAHGDPILFHFSGHGTRKEMPEGHAADDMYGTNTEEDHEIEAIVPYDSTCYEEDDPNALPPIMDYTLGALLRRLANAKGNNITVVLDCCHSGHGTRGEKRKPSPYKSRQLDPRYVPNVKPDTDREIWGAETRGMNLAYAPYRGGLHDTEDTHVLMAACKRTEESQGNELGGVFTRFWLETLREADGLSYGQIKQRIDDKLLHFYSSFREGESPPRQNPQVEGVGRDRPVFENPPPGDYRHRFAVQQAKDKTEVIIFAGEIVGVRPGTIFHLQHMGSQVAGNADLDMLGTAVVTKVLASQCSAKLADGVVLPPHGVRALLTQVADPLRCYINTANPSNEAAVRVAERLHGILFSPQTQNNPWYRLIDDSRDAQIIFEVHEDRVDLIRTEQVFRDLDQLPPIVKARDLEYIFPAAMRYIACFNFYLSLASQNGPFAGDVDAHLHYLEENEPSYSDDQYMKLGDEIHIENGEATVLHEEDTIYGLVLHNRGSQALYPYVLFFDPATYTVMFFYEPHRDVAPLTPGTKLQLGRSPECPAAMWFTIENEQQKDTGFLKVILTTKPMNLHFMEQPPVIGYDRMTGEPNYHATRSASPNSTTGVPQPVKGSWDVKSIKVTVLPGDVA